jgi:hypothetical protein
VQVDVLNALNESVDFVVPDALPKLRSVPTPVVVADSESELNLTPSPSEKGPAEFTRVPANLSKKDLSKEQLKELSSEQTAGTKGNLIDFEVFAEPVPLPKPSRFAR